MPRGSATLSIESPARTAHNRRAKLAIMIVVFGPILLFAIFYFGRGFYKMAIGDPVGYRPIAERAGNRLE